jgi:arylsulfatase A-like enzyme
MKNEKVIEAPVDRNGLTKRYTEVAMQWIEQHQEKPFFLYFPQAMPGSTSKPFTSPAFRGKSKNGPWGDSVEELDWSTGQILDKLVELGIDENTVVVWTSDNGTPMARNVTSPSRGTNKPLFGRGYTTAEGAFRVPTIMWWPGKIPAGTTCSELSTTMDLLPTFAGLAGGQAPQDRKIDGHDVRSLILGEPKAKTPYEVFYYYQRDHLQAIRSGPWKLFLPTGKGPRHPHAVKGKEAKPILFNLVKDIGSQEDVSEQYPKVVKRLMGLAESARIDLGDLGTTGTGQRSIGKVKNPQPQTLPNN